MICWRVWYKSKQKIKKESIQRGSRVLGNCYVTIDENLTEY